MRKVDVADKFMERLFVGAAEQRRLVCENKYTLKKRFRLHAFRPARASGESGGRRESQGAAASPGSVDFLICVHQVYYFW